MNTCCILLLAFAVFGAYAAPLATTGVGCGSTVAETVVTPFHRTDAVTGPCGHSVRTTTHPIGIYGVHGGFPYSGGFLTGTGLGVYPGVVAGGLTGTLGGAYTSTLGATYAGTGLGTAGILNSGLGVFPATVC